MPGTTAPEPDEAAAPPAGGCRLLEDVAAEFLERHHRARGNRSVYDVERAFQREVYPVWGRRPITDITRRDEVAWLRWSELDLDGALWTLPRERTKNDRAHEVPLSRQAVALLRGLPRPTGSDLVFTTTGETPVSGFSHAKDRLDGLVLKDRREEAGRRGEPRHKVKPIPHWVLHGIRRTVTTGLARRGVPPHVADRILNHVQGAIRGVTAVYNRHG